MSSVLPDQNRTIKTDQRQTYRITVTQSILFATRHKASPAGDARLRDLSDSGCCLNHAGQCQAGDRLALVLELPQPVLITDARVVWTNGTLCGLEFVQVSPLELTRLRRFLWKQISHATIDDLQPHAALDDHTPVSPNFRMVP